MTKRSGTHVHYELSFEDLIRKNGVLYIAIDENREPIVDNKSIKNFDFIVSSFNGKYLIDIKGKKFSDRKGGLYLWDNWVKNRDLTGLRVWGNHFNAFVPLLVFPYYVEERHNFPELDDISDRHEFHGQIYQIVAVTLADYYVNAVSRSKKWEAIYVPRNKFKRIAKPLSHFIPEIKRKWEQSD